MEKLDTIKSTDHALIEEIASHLYVSILGVTEDAWHSYGQYNEIVKRLKYMVRDQVEVVCLLNEMKERISLVTSAQRDYERLDRLRNLNFSINYLTLHLMGLFADSGYSSWNLLCDLNNFSPDERTPQWILEHTLSASIDQSKARRQCPKGFDVALSERGMSQQEVSIAESSIGQMLFIVEKYKSLIASFYAPNLEPSAIIYLPQVVESLGAQILSAALLFRVILQRYD